HAGTLTVLADDLRCARGQYSLEFCSALLTLIFKDRQATLPHSILIGIDLAVQPSMIPGGPVKHKTSHLLVDRRPAWGWTPQEAPFDLRLRNSIVLDGWAELDSTATAFCLPPVAPPVLKWLDRPRPIAYIVGQPS